MPTKRNQIRALTYPARRTHSLSPRHSSFRRLHPFCGPLVDIVNGSVRQTQPAGLASQKDDSINQGHMSKCGFRSTQLCLENQLGNLHPCRLFVQQTKHSRDGVGVDLLEFVSTPPRVPGRHAHSLRQRQNSQQALHPRLIGFKTAKLYVQTIDIAGATWMVMLPSSSSHSYSRSGSSLGCRKNVKN